MSEFTAHNILLPNGERTKPEINWLLADGPWMLATRRILQFLYVGRPAGRRILDLGCLEGGYTLEFARMGMRSLGIDVRQSNIEKCHFVRSFYPDLPLDFRKDDVWNSREYGTFDVTFCCGLLYHLDRPLEFLRMIASITSDAIILNTHSAVSDVVELPPGLSPMTQHEGLPGRWYTEYDAATMDPATLEKASWTSWSNSRSFWPTPSALLHALQAVGFDMVFESFDWLGKDIAKAMDDPFYSVLGRRMLVGIRSSAFTQQTFT